MKNASGFSKFDEVSAREQLRAGILTESRLDGLITLFAAALLEDGIDGHYCGRRDDSGVAPLFGDSPWLLSGDKDVVPLTPGTHFGATPCAIDIDGALGERFTVLLAPPIGTPDQAAVARLRGYCALYAARGDVLREKEADLMTACGLSIYERFILGRILVGDSLLDIALKIDRSVAAVESHIADALTTLATTDRRTAIALAARRGWLLTTVNDFSPLSSENNGYYYGTVHRNGNGVTGRASSGDKG